MTYNPPNAANDPTDLPAVSERVKIDERLFTFYFKSLAALQNAWIVAVLGICKAPFACRINKDILETVANVGRSVTAISALLMYYRYSAYDKTHEKLDLLQGKIANFISSLQDLPGFNDELTVLCSALTNFQAHFSLWTPRINTKHMLLHNNFIKANAKMKTMIANMDTAWMAMKAKTD
jgi:hypothetical protein